MLGSFESVTGGIAALDHQLPAGMPPASLWGRPEPSTPVCPHPGGIRACSRRLSLATPPGIQCEDALASRRDASVEARGHSIDSSSHSGGGSDARHKAGRRGFRGGASGGRDHTSLRPHPAREGGAELSGGRVPWTPQQTRPQLGGIGVGVQVSRELQNSRNARSSSPVETPATICPARLLTT